MRLLAGLSAAVCAYLIVSLLTGTTPQRLRRRSRQQREPVGDKGQAWLNQAGARISRPQFLAVSAGCAAVTGVVVWAVSGTWAVALVPAVVVGFAPRLHYARQRDRLTAERSAAWPDALRDLVSHLETAMSLHSALVELGRTGPVPLRPVWQRYTRLVAAIDTRAALDVIRGELADPVSDRIIEVLGVAHEQGTQIVLDILRAQADTATRDLRLANEVATAQLQQKLEAVTSAVLPFGVLVLLCASSEPYRRFYGTGGGFIVICLGSLMALAGMTVIRRLGHLPVEERVLIGEAPR